MNSSVTYLPAFYHAAGSEKNSSSDKVKIYDWTNPKFSCCLTKLNTNGRNDK